MKILDKQYYTFDDVLIQPAYSNINSRENISTTSFFLGKEWPVPIISSNMDYVTGSDMANAMHKAGGLGILHRFTSWNEQLKNIAALQGPITLSVGTRNIADSLQRVEIVDGLHDTARDKFVCVDVAHGDHMKVHTLIRNIKSKFPDWKVIAGNIATRQAAMDYLTLNVDAVKVGIGPGSVCTTRVVTGVGVPQLSAIIEVASVLRGRVSIIADGGIKTSGDIVKALAAGADMVMLGNLLAGSSECPGEVIETGDGRRLRKYRGQSIFGVNGEKFVKEGVSGYVEEKGPVELVLKQLVGGLRSGMSYVGAINLDELRENTTFIPVTANTLVENHPRVLLGV